MIETFLTAFLVLLGAFVAFGVPMALTAVACCRLVDSNRPVLAIAVLVIGISAVCAMAVTAMQHPAIAAITDRPTTPARAVHP